MVRQTIHDAAKEGDTSNLRALLREGEDPNQYDSSGWTPLLWAAVRGHHEAVSLLLDNNFARADAAVSHRESGALAIHMAGQSGSVPTAAAILDRRPEHLDAVWDLNGHTILLQAVFYGHLELTRALLDRRADTSVTTARGLGPMELATQFQNLTLVDVIRPFDSPAESKARNHSAYLRRIAPIAPVSEREAQTKADRLILIIEDGLRTAQADSGAQSDTLGALKELVERQGAEVNRLGGPLQQPALVVTATGNDGLPSVSAVADLRLAVAEYLLSQGADPLVRERHPMGAQTIIRAAVFNHLEILKMCAKVLTAGELADAINEVPVVNGLTAMHDTVLRATMAAPDRFEGYLEQARWLIEHGGRSDIEDFTGTTQRDIAARAADPEVRRRLLAVLDERH